MRPLAAHRLAALALMGLLLVPAVAPAAGRPDHPTLAGGALAPSDVTPGQTPVSGGVVAPDAAPTIVQTSVQTQVAGCLVHCRGTSQMQSAEQLITSMQARRRHRVVQIQVGCHAHCFGVRGDRPRHRLGGAVGKVPRSPHRSRLPRAVGGSAVLSGAWERWVAAARLMAARRAAEAGSAGAVQAVVQLQVGCLEFCRRTSQRQSAHQSQMDTGGALAVPRGSLQSIWQLQLGCRAWCWDVTQRQLARQRR